MKLRLRKRKKSNLESIKLPRQIQVYTPEQLKEKKKLYSDRVEKDKARLKALRDPESEFYKDKVRRNQGIAHTKKRLEKKIDLFQKRIDNDFKMILVYEF